MARASKEEHIAAERQIRDNFPDLEPAISVSGRELKLGWLELDARRATTTVAYCDDRMNDTVWQRFEDVQFGAAQKLAELANELRKQAGYNLDLDGAGWLLWLWNREFTREF